MKRQKSQNFDSNKMETIKYSQRLIKISLIFVLILGISTITVMGFMNSYFDRMISNELSVADHSMEFNIRSHLAYANAERLEHYTSESEKSYYIEIINSHIDFCDVLLEEFNSLMLSTLAKDNLIQVENSFLQFKEEILSFINLINSGSQEEAKSKFEEISVILENITIPLLVIEDEIEDLILPQMITVSNYIFIISLAFIIFLTIIIFSIIIRNSKITSEAADNLDELLNKSINEITKREKVESDLLEEKERLFVTLRNIGDGVITTDREERVIIMNKIAEKITEYSYDESIGKNINEVFKLIDQKTNKPIKNLFDKTIKDGQIISLPLSTILIRKSGKALIIDDSIAPIKDKYSKIIGFVIVFRDVTEQRKLEQEYFNSQKIESIGVLAGGIAHDFNNILTSIIGNISLLRIEGVKDQTNTSLLEEIENAAVQASNLTKELLTFSKGGSPVKTLASITEIIKIFSKFTLHGSKSTIEFDFPDILWPVDVDKSQIGQVIQNLVLNADQAMDKGGIIKINCENISFDDTQFILLESGNYIKITVKDEGKGISQENIHRIFDPYFTTKSNGKGLGLSICHSIVKNHGGVINVESVIEKGSTFSVFLPAKPDEKIKIVNSDHEDPKIFSEKHRFLVLEDEDQIIRMIKKICSHLNFEVKIVKDGSEVISLYQKELNNGRKFDIVLLDLTIPGGLGGEETAKILLNIDSHVKIIISSGYSTGEIMSNYKNYGFKGVLPKPYSINDFSNKINEILNENE